MDEGLRAYFGAWNEPDADARGRLLRQSVVEDGELIDPTGHWRGIDALVERIGRYQASAPGTRVVPASGVDGHGALVRYAWRIVDAEGGAVVDGLDVAERGSDGRLERILMFFGPLPPAG